MRGAPHGELPRLLAPSIGETYIPRDPSHLVLEWTDIPHAGLQHVQPRPSLDDTSPLIHQGIHAPLRQPACVPGAEAKGSDR